jgi:hypothetical protein
MRALSLRFQAGFEDAVELPWQSEPGRAQPR